MNAHELLSPTLRPHLATLRLHARSASAAHGLGQHSSRSRGVGLEFAQYRAYEPGDEPRRVDWKLYARSDRYYVRESERDSPLTVWIVLDASASMQQADAANPEYTKLHMAKTLTAAVIELALRQDDRFGLAALSGSGIELIAAQAGPRQRDRCTDALLRWSAQGGLPDAQRLLPLWERMQVASLVLIVSDFFDEGLTELAVRLAAARREVLALQVLAADERDFPFRGGHRFVDQETGGELRLDAAAARRDFLQRFSAARAALARQFAASGIRLGSQFLDQGAEQSLTQLFGTRAAEAREA